MKYSDSEIKLFQASSSEMFEDVGREKINEHTKLNPLLHTQWEGRSS